MLPAGKGNATVVMNTEDYKKKINDLLDPGSYKELRSVVNNEDIGYSSKTLWITEDSYGQHFFTPHC